MPPTSPPALQHREAPALALEVVREGDAAEPGAQHDDVDVHGGARLGPVQHTAGTHPQTEGAIAQRSGPTACLEGTIPILCRCLKVERNIKNVHKNSSSRNS